MASTLEFEARSIEEAIAKACGQLNISREDLNYEVITKGSSGIFGLALARKAKIRVVREESDVENHTENHKAIKDCGTRQCLEGSNPKASERAGQSADASANGAGIELGSNVLKRIIAGVCSGAELEIKELPDEVVFEITGNDPGILIGRNGQTLEAMQTLVEKIVKKHNEGHLKVRVDVEGYLKNRRINLERMAQRMARKSKKLGKPMTVGRLKAYDRRIIHLALKDDPDVRTHSIGEGAMRKLIISPQPGLRRQRWAKN